MKRNYVYAAITLGCVFYAYTQLSHQPLQQEMTHILYPSVCDVPVTYSIGNVDSKFAITPDDVKTDAATAASLWNNEEGKTIIQYDPASSFKINLVFDERQLLTNEISTMESSLLSQKNSLNPKIAQYNQESADFKQKLDALNQQIDYWNNNGGAPQDVYNQLTQQQQALQTEANQLNALGQELNQTTDQFNAQVGSLNQTINTLNSDMQQKPEEGLYDPANNRIQIYFDNNTNEFIHTLAHEMGHSIGLGHVQNDPQAIMYPYASQTTQLSSSDIAALKKLCERHFIGVIIEMRVSRLLHSIQTAVHT